MGELFSTCENTPTAPCITYKLLDVTCIIHMVIIFFAIYKLYRLRAMTDVSNSRFISLSIVLVEMFL